MPKRCPILIPTFSFLTESTITSFNSRYSVFDALMFLIIWDEPYSNYKLKLQSHSDRASAAYREKFYYSNHWTRTHTRAKSKSETRRRRTHKTFFFFFLESKVCVRKCGRAPHPAHYENRWRRLDFNFCRDSTNEERHGTGAWLTDWLTCMQSKCHRRLPQF